jgi:hypothetical protein
MFTSCRTKIALLFLLLFSQYSFGQFQPPPTTDQKILGAENPIPLGELVDLSLSPLPKLEHLAGSSYTWLVLDSDGTEKKFRPYENGIFFGAGVHPKKMKVLCAVSYLFILKKDEKQEAVVKTFFLTATVVIGDPPPTPPGPGPGPTPPVPPGPTPPLPDGKFGLAKKVYELGARVPAADRKAGSALASAYRGISAAIAAGTIKTPEDSLQKVKEANNAALQRIGVGKEGWIPFFTELQTIVFDLYASRKLNSVGDFAEAFNEIANGLEYIK